MPVRVLIADDHGVLRGGLRALLRAEPDLEVIGEAPDGEAALALVAAFGPDVLLADISMPGPSGIEIAARLKSEQSGTRVLILTMHEDPCLQDEALRAGAAGYIVKRVVESELIKAIRVVAAGGVYLRPDNGGNTAGSQLAAASDNPGNDVPLTERECDILRLIARGYTTRQVAEALCTTVEKADALRAELQQKLGLRSRIELTKYARNHGLL